MPVVTEQAVWDILREIADPEIQTINLVDLGVIRKVSVDERIVVEIMPTFVGCLALDMMCREIKAKLAPYAEIDVKVVYSEIWTTERITVAGRAMLGEAGIAPPARQHMSILPVLNKTTRGVTGRWKSGENSNSKAVYIPHTRKPTPPAKLTKCIIRRKRGEPSSLASQP